MRTAAVVAVVCVAAGAAFFVVRRGHNSEPAARATAAGPELLFPSQPGVAGESLPERGCLDSGASSNCAADQDFTRSDYEGWKTLNGTNERMVWADDPAGIGHTVARFTVVSTDVADQFGGTRASLWENAYGGNCDGCDRWFAFGVLFPVGFTYPNQWMLVQQNFDGTGNPAQAVELRAAPGGTRRDNLFYKFQTAPGSGQNYYRLGPIVEGHWLYVVAQIHFAVASGWGKVWFGQDALPDTALPPAADFHGNTLYPGYETVSRSHLFIYRGPSKNPVQTEIVYFCGFRRTADQANLTLPTC